MSNGFKGIKLKMGKGWHSKTGDLIHNRERHISAALNGKAGGTYAANLKSVNIISAKKFNNLGYVKQFKKENPGFDLYGFTDVRGKNGYATIKNRGTFLNDKTVRQEAVEKITYDDLIAQGVPASKAADLAHEMNPIALNGKVMRTSRGSVVSAGINPQDRILYRVTTNKGSFLFSGIDEEEAIEKAKLMKNKIGFIKDYSLARRLKAKSGYAVIQDGVRIGIVNSPMKADELPDFDPTAEFTKIVPLGKEKKHLQSNLEAKSRIVFDVYGDYGTKKTFLSEKEAKRYAEGTNRIVFRNREFLNGKFKVSKYSIKELNKLNDALEKIINETEQNISHLSGIGSTKAYITRRYNEKILRMFKRQKLRLEKEIQKGLRKKKGVKFTLKARYSNTSNFWRNGTKVKGTFIYHKGATPINIAGKIIDKEWIGGERYYVVKNMNDGVNYVMKASILEKISGIKKR